MSKDEGKVVKKCPFMGGAWCIGKECALSVEMTRRTPMGIEKGDMCCFMGSNIMISEINTKTQVKQEKLTLPLYRG